MKKSGLILIIGLIFSVLISACGPSADEEIMVDEEIVPQANTEPVYVYMDCGETYIQTGREIAIYYDWMTQTRDQLVSFFDVTEHFISSNGVPVDIQEEKKEEIKEMGDGTFKQMVWMKIGVLEPGMYEVMTTADITEPVSDGWDTYGPDSDYPFLQGICTITVGDNPPADITEATQQPTEIPEEPTPAPCSIESPFKQEWDTTICETFDYSTILWTGEDQGTSARIEDGEYILDNSTKVTSGFKTGYTYPIFAGIAQDYMISVDGLLDSKFRQSTWGIYVRSNLSEPTYFFMINNEGQYMLTGSSDQEAKRYLGNIADGSHNSIVWDGANTIAAIVEGKEMQFYVNNELLVTHEAVNAFDPEFGLIVWGGEGVSAVNHFDNLLVRTK